MAAFIDSHAHLVDSAFDTDRGEAIERARQTGCAAIVAIGTSPADSRTSLELAREHPGFVHSSAGLHPHDAASFDALRDPQIVSRVKALTPPTAC